MNSEAEKFMNWLIEKVLKYVEEHGSRELMPQLSWPTPQTLKYLEIFEVSWELPDEKYMPYEAYVEKHGEPSLHGDSVRFGPGNVKLVLLTNQGPVLWTKKKRLIIESSLTF